MKIVARIQDPAEIKKITSALHLPNIYPPPFPAAPQLLVLDPA